MVDDQPNVPFIELTEQVKEALFAAGVVPRRRRAGEPTQPLADIQQQLSASPLGPEALRPNWDGYDTEGYVDHPWMTDE